MTYFINIYFEARVVYALFCYKWFVFKCFHHPIKIFLRQKLLLFSIFDLLSWWRFDFSRRIYKYYVFVKVFFLDKYSTIFLNNRTLSIISRFTNYNLRLKLWQKACSSNFQLFNWIFKHINIPWTILIHTIVFTISSI